MLDEVADSIVGIKSIAKLNVVENMKLRNRTLIKNRTLRHNQVEHVRFVGNDRS